MNCEEKLRFWREAAKFWRKEVERTEKKEQAEVDFEENEDKIVTRQLMKLKMWRNKENL